MQPEKGYKIPKGATIRLTSNFSKETMNDFSIKQWKSENNEIISLMC